MLPIDSVTKEPWSNKNANLKLGELRATLVTEFRQRDERVSKGELSEATGYKTTLAPAVTEEKSADGTITRRTSTRLRADRHLSQMKHNGKDVTTVLCGRWATFCSKPRNEKAETAHLIEAQRKTTIGAKVEAATGLETELAEVSAALLADDSVEPKPASKGNLRGGLEVAAT